MCTDSWCIMLQYADAVVWKVANKRFELAVGVASNVWHHQRLQLYARFGAFNICNSRVPSVQTDTHTHTHFRKARNFKHYFNLHKLLQFNSICGISKVYLNVMISRRLDMQIALQVEYKKTFNNNTQQTVRATSESLATGKPTTTTTATGD